MLLTSSIKIRIIILYGPVAQLGEYHLDMVGVAGSRPVGTIFKSIF